jgi:hypothetical protein
LYFNKKAEIGKNGWCWHCAWVIQCCQQCWVLANACGLYFIVFFLIFILSYTSIFNSDHVPEVVRILQLEKPCCKALCSSHTGVRNRANCRSDHFESTVTVCVVLSNQVNTAQQ